MDLLFPPSGNPPDSKTFDITLLTVLLRNICGLHPPATGWNTMPPDTDNSPAANITRIKLLRNEVYAHVSSTEIDNATFENLWQKVSKALVDLKVPIKEIDDLKTCALAPEEEICMQTLKEWYLKDENCKNLIVGLKEQHSESDLRQQDNYNKLASSLQHITEEIQQIRTEEPQIKRPRLDSRENEVCEKSKSSIDDQYCGNLQSIISRAKYEVKLSYFIQARESGYSTKLKVGLRLKRNQEYCLSKPGLGLAKVFSPPKFVRSSQKTTNCCLPFLWLFWFQFKGSDDDDAVPRKSHDWEYSRI